MGHHFLQGIFLTEGSNPCLLHWQADSLPLSHQGSPQLWVFNCSNTICWKGYPSSNELLLKEAGHVCVCLFLVLYPVLMMHVSIPLPMPYCLDYYSCVVNLNKWCLFCSALSSLNHVFKIVDTHSEVEQFWVRMMSQAMVSNKVSSMMNFFPICTI